MLIILKETVCQFICVVVYHNLDFSHRQNVVSRSKCINTDIAIVVDLVAKLNIDDMIRALEMMVPCTKPFVGFISGCQCRREQTRTGNYYWFMIERNRDLLLILWWSREHLRPPVVFEFLNSNFLISIDEIWLGDSKQAAGCCCWMSDDIRSSLFSWTFQQRHWLKLACVRKTGLVEFPTLHKEVT